MSKILSFEEGKNAHTPYSGPVERVTVGKEEFIQAVGASLSDRAFELSEDRELFRRWVKRLKLEEEIPLNEIPDCDPDALFWKGFIMGGMFETAADLDQAEERAAEHSKG